EGVYVDLDLERNWNHPDNRGWMNQFRHWVWVPMFRLVLSLTLQTHGSRFVRFCETHLDMPRLDDKYPRIKDDKCVRIKNDKYLQIKWDSCSTVPGLRSCAKSLYECGKINFIELSLLRSRATLSQVRGAKTVYVGT